MSRGFAARFNCSSSDRDTHPRSIPQAAPDTAGNRQGATGPGAIRLPVRPAHVSPRVRSGSGRRLGQIGVVLVHDTEDKSADAGPQRNRVLDVAFGCRMVESLDTKTPAVTTTATRHVMTMRTVSRRRRADRMRSVPTG